MEEKVRRDEELNTQRRANLLNLQYIDTSALEKPIYKDVLRLDEMRQWRLVPIYNDDENVQFGVTNTTSQRVMDGLRQRFHDQRVAFGLISESGYREYMKLYDPPQQVVYENIQLHSPDQAALINQVSQILEQVRADDMLAYLVHQAHRLNASDIHLETQRDFVRIRFRIDGVLHPVAQLSHEKYRILISAIASAGNVSTASSDAQQGHISHRVKMANDNEVDVNLRLETVPTVTGMDAVMRLFNMDQTMYQLDKLGLMEDERAIVDEIIAKPSGLVLAVGPTGSGKTTTLYSMLNSLNSSERKLITIEDPVEYHFTGITQISVTSKTTQETNFAEKLRAVLRLDPDIVMVGEIRDTDTAKTALQASLTGHLVLSTFHASSAAAALTRLMDVIDQNPLFASAIRLVMAQRLVRKLDDASKQAYQPDEATMRHIGSVLETLPPHVERPEMNSIKLYRPGSSQTNPYGFSGQIALREQLLMTDEILQLIDGKHAFSTHDIELAAVRSGMRTMLQDGILKAIAGYTTLDEVYRVLG